MNQELKEQAHKEFDCFEDGCGECQVCEYLNFREWAEGCAPSGSSIERNECIENYLKKKQALIDRTVQKTEERIVGILENEIVELEIWAKVTKNEQDVKEYNFAVFVLKKVLKSLITNKSDSNIK